jgi:hypothetical protein
MELTLATKKLDKHENKDGITQIGVKDLIVIDNETGEKLTGHSGFLWGGRDLLLKPMEESILTPEHLEGHLDDASYLILIVRCDKAIEL